MTKKCSSPESQSSLLYINTSLGRLQTLRWMELFHLHLLVQSNNQPCEFVERCQFRTDISDKVEIFL